MNRPAPHSRRIPYIVAGTALFALLAFLLSQTGYYSFCYLEQWDTFIYNSAYLSGSLALPGGCVQLLSSFLTQFFCRPLTGILITALLLTWIALLTADILHRWKRGVMSTVGDVTARNVVLGQIRGEAVYVFDLEDVATVIALHRKVGTNVVMDLRLKGVKEPRESDIWLLGAIGPRMVYSTNLDAARRA